MEVKPFPFNLSKHAPQAPSIAGRKDAKEEGAGGLKHLSLHYYNTLLSGQLNTFKIFLINKIFKKARAPSL